MADGWFTGKIKDNKAAGSLPADAVVDQLIAESKTPQKVYGT